MDLDKNDYFFAQKAFLLLSGVSFSENRSIYYRIYSYIVCTYRTLWIFLLLAEVSGQIKDLNNLMRPAIFMFGIMMEIMKTMALHFNRLQLNKAMKALQSGVFLPNADRGGDVEAKWLKECIDFGRKQTLVGFVTGVFTLTTIIMSCYIRKMLNSNDSTKWELPFGKTTVFDATSSPNYELVWFMEGSGIFIAGLTYISTDIYMSNILSHIATQCRMLNNSIKHFAARSVRKMKEETGLVDYSFDEAEIDSSKIPWKYLKSTIKEIVDYHTSLIEVANSFENVFQYAMLSEHLGVLLVLCCVMYDGSLFPPSDSRFLQDLFIACAVLLQVCAVGYYGNLVINESNLMAESCCEADFVGTDVRFQKAWSLIIQRSQKPITFTIYKVTPLALTTSIAMLKAAVSYFMVLQKMADKK